jgi:hypothetical protein
LLSALGVASRRAKPRWKLFLEEIGHPEMHSILPEHAFLERQFSKAFVCLLDTLTLDHGKFIWVEKTPGHLRSVDQIERLVNGARFLHIMRNGLDNIASLFAVSTKYPEDWGRWYGTIDQCIHRWVEDVRISKECASRENHQLIQYEGLVAHSRSVLIELCEFIGVPYEEKMLTDYSAIAEGLILRRELWKASVRDPIRADSSSRSDALTEEQREYIFDHIPKELREFAMPESFRMSASCES